MAGLKHHVPSSSGALFLVLVLLGVGAFVGADRKDFERTTDMYVVVLDESGSMMSAAETTLRSLRSFHQEQQDVSTPESVFQLVAFSFDSELRLNARLGDPLDFAYKPSGGTALLDAIGYAIKQTSAAIDAAVVRPKDVYVIIVTDGMENSSRMYSRTHIKLLIETYKERGWKFIFLGANQDAITVGEDLGVGREGSMTYSQDDEGISYTFKSLGDAISRQKASNSNSILFSDSERQGSMGEQDPKKMW